MKIDLTFIDLRNQKIVKQYEGYLELLPDRLLYKHEFKAEEPKDKDDASIGWEKVMNCYETVVPKDRLSSVALEFVQATEENKNEFSRWKIIISISGTNTDISIYFSEETEARSLYSEVCKWLFDAG